MANGIAVVGRRDSVEYFRILGCDVYETRRGELVEDKFEDIISRGHRIVFITEEAFGNYREIIRERKDLSSPVITIIPDLGAAGWKDGVPVPGKTAFRELRDAVVRAVGQDISNVGGAEDSAQQDNQ